MTTECATAATESDEIPPKPLYLGGTPPPRVELDGPALRVTRPAHAAQWYPLVRLSRVFSARSVRWDSRALLACAALGIPVLFVDRASRILGLLVGSAARDDGRFWRICALATRPDGARRYSEWRQAMECHALRVVAWQTQLPLAGLETAQVRERLAEEKSRHAPPLLWQAIERRLGGLLTLLCAELLTHAGLNAQRLACLNNDLDSLEDLAGLLAWALELPLLQALRERTVVENLGTGQEAFDWTALFEAQVPDLRRLAKLMLDCLEQALAP